MRQATRRNAETRVNIRPPSSATRGARGISIIIVVAVHFVSIRRAGRSLARKSGAFLRRWRRRRRGRAREEDDEEDGEESRRSGQVATW